MKKYLLTSPRLGFRPWEEADLPAFTAINQDAAVMEHFPATLRPEETEHLFLRLRQHFRDYGYCFFAVDRLDTGHFIGFIGLSHPRFDSFFTPCVEIGWRLARAEWGQGLATEGALACLDYGFNQLGLSEIYSYTPATNKASERVMQKIGMEKAGEFGHPLLAEESPLYRHVLYRIGQG
ncbi:MAG: GNAT family N-acetyltransferase [Lewinellaceae bacterium]|nr:GNAT family N-acetyltransferase [Phaeodactylibacter sp.]MCB0613625.1 GNAT family N-acetyltransferase [Phaeodactylibacter sp.]MCB9348733.1 GNAT family N-acetyltransferase [Lewinellaceae bacterium]